MSYSFWLLGVESRDISQGEKEGTACKGGKIHRMITIFTQNDNLGPLKVRFLHFLTTLLTAKISFEYVNFWPKI